MRHHLIERELVGFEALVKAADSYALTQKLGKGQSQGQGQSKGGKGRNGNGKGNSGFVKPHCSKCGHYGSEHTKCPEKMKNITCPKCGKKGHFGIICKETKEKSPGKGSVSLVKSSVSEKDVFFLLTYIKVSLNHPHAQRKGQVLPF